MAVEQTQQLLARWNVGEDAARNELIARIYPELSQIAAARLRGERGTSLSTSDLVNDAVMRVSDGGAMSVADRAHLLALMSKIMRNILVDHARSRGADKRRHQKVELNSDVDGGQRLDLIELETALIRLRALDASLAELVEMRYFGGMTVEEVAVVTALSEPTVKRRWQVARAWLLDALASRIDHE